MEGASAVVVPFEEMGRLGPSQGMGLVEKRLKRKNTQKNANLERERAFHAEVAGIMAKEMSGMRVAVPTLFETGESTARYVMSKVDTSQPMYDEDWWNTLSAEKQKELEWRVRIVVKSFAARGIFLRDVECFYDKKVDLVYFLDFGQVYRGEPTNAFRFESASMLPPTVTIRLVGSDRPTWAKHCDVPEASCAGGGCGSSAV